MFKTKKQKISQPVYDSLSEKCKKEDIVLNSISNFLTHRTDHLPDMLRFWRIYLSGGESRNS